MDKIKQFIKLMRIKHYIKNFLVFIPLFFSGDIFNKEKIIVTILGFISFCLLSSAIYCFNDIKDVENDKKHPTKRERPIASGKISKNSAIIFAIILVILSFSITALTIKICSLSNGIIVILLELLYLLLNVIYSCGLKKLPVIDIIILTSGFIIRLLFGANLTNIIISNWLYLTVMAGAFYLGFGKRRNEIIMQGEKSREVLKKYSVEFLDKFMYICLTLSIVFYSLWCIDANTIQRIGNNYMIWTVPILLVIFMKYSLNVEMESNEDPVETILKDKSLIILITIFSLIVFGILYIK